MGVVIRCREGSAGEQPLGPYIVDDDLRTNWLRSKGFASSRFWHDLGLREADEVMAAIQDALSAR